MRALVLAALVACGPAHQTVRMVNRTSQLIEAVYIYPSAAADHGASRAQLAPNAEAQVSVAAGNIDVLAVTAKVKVDDVQSETRSATQTIELRGPVELVFHDAGQHPADLSRPGTIGVAFQVTDAAAPPPKSPTGP